MHSEPEEARRNDHSSDLCPQVDTSRPEVVTRLDGEART